jgi:Anti-sigma-K factor rskA/Putative zinc-finger
MNHDEVAELLGAFALDAVDGQDKAAVRQHLIECHQCQAELADFHEVAGLLANAGGDAPPQVWDRIAERVASPVAIPGEKGSQENRGTVVRLVPGQALRKDGGRERGHRIRQRAKTTVRSAMPIAAAAALVVIALLGFQVAHLNDRVGKLADENVGQGMSQAVEAALLDPNATRVQLTSAEHQGKTLGQIVILPSGSAFMINSDMAGLPADETYQLWGRAGGTMISISLLGNHPADVALTIDPTARFGEFAVTVEPAGGTVSPTVSPVAASSTV